jgi:adenylate cyclase
MNTAARLESANKALASSIMASREFAEASGLTWWRQMGRVQLRGRAKPVDLFEPTPDFPEADRMLLAEASDLATAGDRAGAIRLVQEVAQRHTDDSALRNLLERMQDIDEGGTYVLG